MGKDKLKQKKTSGAWETGRKLLGKSAEKSIDILGKSVDKSIDLTKGMWKGFSDMINKLGVKKYLAPIMSALTGMLAWFGIERKKKKGKEKKEGVAKKDEEKDEEKRGGIPEQLAAARAVIEAEKIEAEKEAREANKEGLLKKFDHRTFKSAPFERGAPTEKYPRGITLCAKTAYLTLKEAGFTQFFPAQKAFKALTEGRDFNQVGLPSGDAWEVRDYYMVSTKFKKIVGANEYIGGELAKSSANVIDLVVKSRNMDHSHRAVAIRSSVDGKLYVYDPYSASHGKIAEQDERRRGPIPFEDYKGKILIAIPLEVRGESDEVSEAVAGTPAGKVLRVASEDLSNPPDGLNCWQWVDRVFKQVKVKRKPVFNKAKTHNYKHFAGKEELAQIKPGDHLYINNQNGIDKFDNHSVIFMNWVGPPSNMKALLASSWASADHPTAQVHNLNPDKLKKGDRKNSSTPVTYIAHPV